MASLTIPATTYAPASQKLLKSSGVTASVAVSSTAGNKTLASVTIPADILPTGTSIAEAYAAVSWGMQVESSGSDNAVDGAQEIQIQQSGAAAWTDAIDVADNSLFTTASTSRGGIVLFGADDISAIIEEDVTIDFRWESAQVDGDSLTFYDFQTFIIVYFS